MSEPITVSKREFFLFEVINIFFFSQISNSILTFYFEVETKYEVTVESLKIDKLMKRVGHFKSKIIVIVGVPMHRLPCRKFLCGQMQWRKGNIGQMYFLAARSI
jgi:hypothetical protein